VLTAAGLPDEDFKYLHNEPKVAEVFLYCANEERAKLLMRNFQKIGGFGLKKEQVV
jgi:Uri superfamily endonuclease